MSEFVGTIHNSASKGEIAKTVIMPGDPLRAKFIAENYLENYKEVNHIRNMFAYTGTYKGKQITVMGSGMGIPSMAIYSYELYDYYDVDNIIRIGSCGGYLDEMNLFDVVLVEASFSRSSFAKVAFGYEEDLMYPDKSLTDKIEEIAKQKNKHIYKGIVQTGDAFYRNRQVGLKDPYPTIAGEMESFALFANARYLNKKAACMLTVSDKKERITTPEERQLALREMIEIALDTAITL